MSKLFIMYIVVQNMLRENFLIQICKYMEHISTSPSAFLLSSLLLPIIPLSLLDSFVSTYMSYTYGILCVHIAKEL